MDKIQIFGVQFTSYASLFPTFTTFNATQFIHFPSNMTIVLQEMDLNKYVQRVEVQIFAQTIREELPGNFITLNSMYPQMEQVSATFDININSC